jgi:hypothetical protein
MMGGSKNVDEEIIKKADNVIEMENRGLKYGHGPVPQTNQKE